MCPASTAVCFFKTSIPERKLTKKQRYRRNVGIRKRVLRESVEAAQSRENLPRAKMYRHVLDHSVEEDVFIHTEEIANKVKKWRQINGVSAKTFAHGVLGITEIEFIMLSTIPKDWLKLEHGERQLFLRLHNFMEASEDKKNEILELNSFPEIDNTPESQIPKDVLLDFIEGTGEGLLTPLQKKWELFGTPGNTPEFSSSSVQEGSAMEHLKTPEISRSPIFRFDTLDGPIFEKNSDLRFCFDLGQRSPIDRNPFAFNCMDSSQPNSQAAGVQLEIETTLEKLHAALEEGESLKRKLQALLGQKSANQNPEGSGELEVGEASIVVAGGGRSRRTCLLPQARRTDARHLGLFQPLANSTPLLSPNQEDGANEDQKESEISGHYIGSEHNVDSVENNEARNISNLFEDMTPEHATSLNGAN